MPNDITIKSQRAKKGESNDRRHCWRVGHNKEANGFHGTLLRNVKFYRHIQRAQVLSSSSEVKKSKRDGKSVEMMMKAGGTRRISQSISAVKADQRQSSRR